LIANTEKTQVTGIPGLADIPVLRYLFSIEKREVISTEFVVTLTPRVVRLPASMLEAVKAVTVEGGGPEPASEAPPPAEVGPRPPEPQE